MLIKQRNRQAAFTLMELLVVVIIIGVLASISTAFYTKTIDEAQKKQAKSMLNLLRSAEGIYWGRERNFYYFDPLNGTVRDVLMIDVYNNEDWEYKFPDNGTSKITATRMRGSHTDGIITINVATGDIDDSGY